jgi:hypothetical protein
LAVLAPLQSPLAVHEVGLLVELHVKVEWFPTVIEDGLTVSETDGGLGNT